MFRPAKRVRFGIVRKSIDDEPDDQQENGKIDDSETPFFTAFDLDRRMRMVGNARDTLKVLPEPGQAVHTLMDGNYDLMHAVVALIGVRGHCKILRMATLSLNLRNIGEALMLKDSGQAADIRLICSGYFARTSRDVFTTMQTEFAKRGMKVVAPPCHAKVITLEFADGTKMCMEGSANLRTNRNFEQLTIINHGELHDFHAGWIDAKIAKYSQAEIQDEVSQE